jgi:signal transduction histidine kinase
MGNEIRQNRISLRLQIADDLPAVQVDRVQLQQVMLNLIMNAIEAISAAGGARRDIVIRCKMGGENSVRVSFEDSGIGIDPARLDRLFETFYTTKPEGMGIGLAISRSIVETHGGQMHAAPLSPRGALIEFTLPIRRGTMR